MKVFIIETSYPEDFFSGRLDGDLTHQLLGLMGIRSRRRYVLNGELMNRALAEASKLDYEVLHISCHGDEEGIALANNDQPTWEAFASTFENAGYAPKALVMSACCGGSSGIAKAFAKSKCRPEIIFGSVNPRVPSTYAVAWAILYRRFNVAVKREDSYVGLVKRSLREINAVVGDRFCYYRWDTEKCKYLLYPAADKKFEIVEKVRAIRPASRG